MKSGTEVTKSVETLRLVGYTFGDKPGAGAHVEAVSEKYNKKKWMLYHLRDAGFKGKQLFRLYCCYIRSIIEYCSVVYHALLTKSQEARLERLQRHAVRLCFGHEVPVGETMAREAIETLAARREKRCDAFIKKNMINARFGASCFPPRPEIPWSIRNKREVQEIQAVTHRRFVSPLAFLRRRANNLGVSS